MVERIAVGGMAEIFLATAGGAEGFARKVVVKRLLPHMKDDSQFNAMFIDEAKLTAQLTHPKIAQTYELGKQGEQLYIVMEYIDGIDALAMLRECALRRIRVPAKVAVHIAHEVLDALDFAHGQVDDRGEPLGIVHRDVSPSNILLSVRGDIKLVDFGIARASAQSHKTQAGTLKGKYGYMSPEQVMENNIDCRSDIFSVGIVLAEMLTGRRLFAAANELDVLLMVRDVKLDRLEKYGKEIPGDLLSILTRALEKKREDRPQTAGIFRDELSEWMFANQCRVSSRDISEVVATLYEDARARARESIKNKIPNLEIANENQPVAVVSEEEIVIPSRESAPLASGSVRAQTVEVPVDCGEIGSTEVVDLDVHQEIVADSIIIDSVAMDNGSILVCGMDDDVTRPFLMGEPIEIPGISLMDGGVQDIEIAGVEISTEDTVGVAMVDLNVKSDLIEDGFVTIDTEERTRAILRESSAIIDAAVPDPPALPVNNGYPQTEGDFSETPPLTVLYQFADLRKTGLLTVTVGRIRKDIYLRDGDPEYASSNVAGELLGEYLVKNKVVSQGELAMALAMMPHFSGKLGDTLVGLGLVKPLDIFRHLTTQVCSKIVDVCTWSKGSYQWFDNRTNDQEVFPLDLSAFTVLGLGALALPQEAVNTWFAGVSQQTPNISLADVASTSRFGLGEVLNKVLEDIDGTQTIASIVGNITKEQGLDTARLLRLLVCTDTITLS